MDQLNVPVNNIPEMKTEKKPKSKIIIAAIVVALILIGAGVYYALVGKKTETPASTSTTTPSASTTTTDETASWKTYSSTELGLSFKYPESWGNVKTFLSDRTSGAQDMFGGKSFVVSFDNGGASVSGFTSDYKNYLSISGDSYTGSKASLDDPESAISSPKDWNNGPNFVKKVTVADQKTTYKTMMQYAPEASGISVLSRTYLNGKTNYKGIAIERSYKTIYDRLGNYYSPTGDNNALEEKAATELQGLFDKNSSDATALANYNEYITWLSTFQFDPTASSTSQTAPVSGSTTPVVTQINAPTCPVYSRTVTIAPGEYSPNSFVSPDKIIETSFDTATWGGLGTFKGQNDKSFSVNWTYDVPGNYDLTLTLTNKAGSCTATAKATVMASGYHE